MELNLAEVISGEIGLSNTHVSAVLSLLGEGATVPFIARYRKEATGSMDEVSIIDIRDRSHALQKLEERRKSILASLRERGKLTPELQGKLKTAGTLTALEDIYLPHRPRRTTRADKARKKGLEPLATCILSQETMDPGTQADGFIDPDNGVKSRREALDGASDIIAELLSHDPDTRNSMRSLYWRDGVYRSRVLNEEKGAKFRDYFQWEEKVSRAPSHRVLAMRRGEREKVLSLTISVPEEKAVNLMLPERRLPKNSPCWQLILDAATDGFKRLLGPSMETETRLRSRKEAEGRAISVFASNLRNLLLAPPLGEKPVLAVDPGFRTGCKIAALDAGGGYLEDAVIFPFHSSKKRAEAEEIVAGLLQTHGITTIAVGNGTAGRETESFLRKCPSIKGSAVISVNESGASVYSASSAAREEFPNLDITVRGAISIGRRLQDPLAELVKIDPKSIGVGQYQHDVDQKQLKRSLDDTVTSCVNLVGVDVNTASRELLSYVSGISPRNAEKIVGWRRDDSAFKNRQQLLKVPGLGDVTFQQCAGFLRIRNGEDPLDNSSVHPESYWVVESMAKSLGVTVNELIGSKDLIQELDPENFVSSEAGLPTVRDIITELGKPGRDPRSDFKQFNFADVHQPSDLETGMVLPGIVTNVTGFGAFVDVGVHQDGLVHISEMSDSFVKDPSDMVSAGDRIKVRVLSVDLERKRISLSMKETV